MRVLIMPRNIGSEMNYRVLAYKKIGIEVKALAFTNSQMASNENIVELPEIPNVYNPIKRVQNTLEYRKILKEHLNWADIVHWVYDLNYIPFTNISIEFDILRKSNVPGVIQWCGSDIRNHEIEMATNEYFKQAFLAKEWGYAEHPDNSIRNQVNFWKLNYIPLLFPTMGKYIIKDLFKKTLLGHIMVGATSLVPNFPKINENRPLIVHAPSKRGTKGTKYIVEAINLLREKYLFNFELIEGMPRNRALEKYSKADIFIDQLIGGGYGSASVEAMALGKPVICFINPITRSEYPVELPIINANPDNIYLVLENLLINSELRLEIGIKSRNYVELYHDDVKNAKLMLKLYYELLNK